MGIETLQAQDGARTVTQWHVQGVGDTGFSQNRTEDQGGKKLGGKGPGFPTAWRADRRSPEAPTSSQVPAAYTCE